MNETVPESDEVFAYGQHDGQGKSMDEEVQSTMFLFLWGLGSGAFIALGLILFMWLLL